MNILDHTEMQGRLQEEYDLVCSMLIKCYLDGEHDGYNEYLWRKHEIERVSDAIHVGLLKKRDTGHMLDTAMARHMRLEEIRGLR